MASRDIQHSRRWNAWKQIPMIIHISHTQSDREFGDRIAQRLIELEIDVTRNPLKRGRTEQEQEKWLSYELSKFDLFMPLFSPDYLNDIWLNTAGRFRGAATPSGTGKLYKDLCKKQPMKRLVMSGMGMYGLVCAVSVT